MALLLGPNADAAMCCKTLNLLIDHLLHGLFLYFPLLSDNLKHIRAWHGLFFKRQDYKFNPKDTKGRTTNPIQNTQACYLQISIEGSCISWGFLKLFNYVMKWIDHYMLLLHVISILVFQMKYWITNPEFFSVNISMWMKKLNEMLHYIILYNWVYCEGVYWFIKTHLAYY